MSVHCLTVETFDVNGLADISSGTTLPIINFTCLLKIVWDGYIKFLTEWCFLCLILILSRISILNP